MGMVKDLYHDDIIAASTIDDDEELYDREQSEAFDRWQADRDVAIFELLTEMDEEINADTTNAEVEAWQKRAEDLGIGGKLWTKLSEYRAGKRQPLFPDDEDLPF